MREIVKVLMLSAMLCGLCAPTQANTTPDDPKSPGAAAEMPAPAVTYPVSPGFMPVITQPLAQPAPQIARVALLLPLRSEGLRKASEAIRAGFLAAYEYERSGIAVNVIDSGEATDEVLSNYLDALRNNEVVVGPLSRSAVSAVAESDAVSKPTIALNQPEQGDTVLPKKMLVMGLSIEDEARQAASWANANKPIGNAFVISADASWQQRAAKAFMQKWQKMGREVQLIELETSAGYLSANGLAHMKIKMQNEKPALLFLALDPQQAREARMVAGKEIALFGTSQLNPVALTDQSKTEPVPEFNGVRLLDLPWQVQADHAAVMIYPHLDVPADQKRSADIERLYALGIDAFRVAREIAMNNASFEVDGVTGRLSVRFSPAAVRFDRIEQQAIFRDGVIVPVLKTP